MTDELEMTLAIIAVAIICYSFALMMFLAVPPKWLDDWMDKKAKKRQMRRLDRMIGWTKPKR